MSARSVMLLVLVLLLVGCRQELVETTLPPPPTVEQTRATQDSTTEVGSEALSTPPAETQVAATAVSGTGMDATPTLAPTATTSAATLQIMTPAGGAQLPAGREVAVSGQAPAGSEVTVQLNAAGLTLADLQVSLGEGQTAWQTTLTMPANMTGGALILAGTGEGAVVQQPVELVGDTATSGPAVTLLYPASDSPIAGGHVLFFTGQVQEPAESMMTIAVLYQECQTEAASQSFGVGAGGAFWGYVIIPETVNGPACAVAYLGEFAGEGWQLAHTPITILEADDPAARGLFIGNFPHTKVVPGSSVRVYGSAFNSADVTVRLEVEGAPVREATAVVDRFGYWETALTLPRDTTPAADALLVAEVSDQQGTVTHTVPIDIVSE